MTVMHKFCALGAYIHSIVSLVKFPSQKTFSSTVVFDPSEADSEIAISRTDAIPKRMIES